MMRVQQLRRLSPKSRIGENNGRWKGGRIQHKPNYYVQVWQPSHHFASKQGYVPEHRLVWEQTHNACLLKKSHVHHINGIKDDNRPENLQAMTQKQHLRLERQIDMSQRKCFWCESMKTKTCSRTNRPIWFRREKETLICYRCHQKDRRSQIKNVPATKT